MHTKRNLIKDKDVCKKVKEIIESARKPVSVDYVAYHVGIGWQTARAILFRLALIGEIEAIETTKSFIFQKKGGSNC